MGNPTRTAAPLAWASLLLVLGFAALLYVPVALDTGLWDPGETALALALEAAAADGDVLAALAPTHPHALARPPLLLAALDAGLTLADGAGLRLPGLLAWLLLLSGVHLVLGRWVGTARALAATTLLAASPAALLGATHTLADGMTVGLQGLTLLIVFGAMTAPDPSRQRTLALTAAGGLTGTVLLTGGALAACVVLGTLALAAIATRDHSGQGADHPERTRSISPWIGGVLLAATALLPVFLFVRGDLHALGPTWWVLSALTVPSAFLLMAAAQGPLRALSSRQGAGFWLALVATSTVGGGIAGAAAGLEPILHALATRPYVVGLSVPAPVQFDHGIRWASFGVFPVLALVPLGFAWLGARREEAGPDFALRRLLLAWATVAFLAHALAGTAAGAPVAPIAVPLVLACALAITDAPWLTTLRARTPATLNLLGLSALLLLLMASRDVRGYQNLDLGRPGPHVIFEPALLDGALPFPESYAFALIRLFLVLWAGALALLFWGPAVPGLRRWLDRLGGPAGATALGAAAFVIACAGWATELALRDFPHMGSHSSTRDVARSATDASPRGPVGLVGDAVDARGWYLRTPPAIVLDDPADLRRFLCAPQDDTRPVAIVPRAEWSRIWSQLRRPLPPHRIDRDLPEACAEPMPLAVLDARGKRHLLVASQAQPGESDDNPLHAVLSSASAIPHDAVRPDEAPLFGGGLRLLAWRLAPEPDAARQVKVELWWEIERSVAGAWQMFLHAEAPGRRTVTDSPPMRGLYPVADWVPGEVLHDRLTIEVPPRAPAEQWTVYAGLFRGDSRMPIAPETPEDRYPIGRFRTP